MKLTCSTKKLIEQLSIVLPITKGQGGKAVPEIILAAQTSDPMEIIIGATDLELSMTLNYLDDETEVAKPGEVFVNASKLASILKEIKAEKITIESEDENAIITAGKSTFRINGIRCGDYPPMPPRLITKESIWVHAKVLRDMIEKTAFAMAREKVHYSLNGLNMQMHKGKLTIVGTDGRRLAVRSIDIHQQLSSPDIAWSAIVPSKAVNVIAKALATLDAEGDIVEIKTTENVMHLTAFEIHISTLLIEGKYPDYRRAIPKNNQSILSVAREDLLRAMVQAGIFAEAEQHIVSLSLSHECVQVVSDSAGIGDAEIEIDAAYVGEPMALQFNASMWIEFLRLLDNEEINIRLKDGATGAIVEADDGYLVVIMPMVQA